MQTYKSNMQLDPAPGGPGGGGDAGWAGVVATFPEEIRSDPSLASIKTVPDLAKSYVNAQKLIGAKRTALPDQNWKPEQYSEFYKLLGRPDAADGYKNSDAVKPREGVAIDEARMKGVKEKFHQLGLSARQGQEILDLYLGELNQTHESMHNVRSEAIKAGELALKDEWKDKYDANVDIAKAVLKKFDKDGAITQRLDQTGLGNDPVVIKFFNSIGQMLTEDRGRAGGPALQLQGATQAAQSIEALKTDNDFMKALFTREHPGHQAAVDKWTLLHEQAFPKEGGQR